MEIKVGDYVRILENGYGVEYEGRIGRITRDSMVSTKEGLEEHREDGEDFHLCFYKDEYELVGTIKRLKLNPGDIVECVGYIDTHDYYWWTIGKKYVVTADGTPAGNEGHTYGEYDDPQPAILFAIVSRATDQEKEEPVVEKEWDTLKNLNVKPGDVVTNETSQGSLWTILADRKLWSHQLDEEIEYGLWDTAEVFKIVNRNSVLPLNRLFELDLAPGDVVLSADLENWNSVLFPYGKVFTIGKDNKITAANGGVLCTESVAHSFRVLKQKEVKQMKHFQVGDRVRIIGPIRTAMGYIGDTGTIEAIEKGGRLWSGYRGEYYKGATYEINGWWYGEDAIELVAHHTLEELGVKPGDVVACYNNIHEGTECVVNKDWKEWGGAPESWWEIVSRATEQQKEEPEMKVGARVRVIANTCVHGFDIGQVVVLKGVFHGSLCFHSEGDPEDSWYMTTEDFVRVEDEFQVFYQLEGIGFFEREPAYYDKRLVLNHTTGTFTLSDF